MEKISYDQLLDKATAEMSEFVFNKRLQGKELFMFLRRTNDENKIRAFWKFVQERLPPAKRLARIYFMLYYSRRFFEPLGDKRRYEIAKYLSEANLGNLTKVTNQLIQIYSDVHPQVVRSAVQLITQLKRQKRKEWSQVIISFKIKAEAYNTEMYLEEKRQDTNYNNTEASELYVAPTKALSSGSSQSEFTDYYSYSEDSDFNQLNQKMMCKTVEEYDEKLMYLVRYRAIQLKKDRFKTLFDVYHYYETHPNFFESLWENLQFGCEVLDVNPKIYFDTVVYHHLLYPLNDAQIRFLIDNIDYYYNSSSWKRQEFIHKVHYHELFKDNSIEFQISFMTGLIERTYERTFDQLSGSVKTRKQLVLQQMKTLTFLRTEPLLAKKFEPPPPVTKPCEPQPPPAYLPSSVTSKESSNEEEISPEINSEAVAEPVVAPTKPSSDVPKNQQVAYLTLESEEYTLQVGKPINFDYLAKVIAKIKGK